MCVVLSFAEILFFYTKLHSQNTFTFPDLTARAHGPSTKSPVKAFTRNFNISAQAVREANANADALLLEEEEEAANRLLGTS